MRVASRAQNRLKACVVLCFVAVMCGGVYLQAMPRAAAQAQSKAAPPTERGRTLYAQHCTRCHGDDGRSQTEQGELYGATDLTSARWWKDEHINDRRLTNSIAHGKKGGMPAFGERLVKADIAALVAYVRTFKR